MKKTKYTQESTPEQILISWVGTTDINSMNKWLDSFNSDMNMLEGDVKIPESTAGFENGPLRTFTDYYSGQSKKIFLLLSHEYEKYKDTLLEWVAEGNDCSCQAVKTGVTDPTDYDEIYKAIDLFFRNHLSDVDPGFFRINLTPGTPAMQAMMLYMSQIRYSGSKAYRVLPYRFAKNGQQVIEVNLPFKIDGSMFNRDLDIVARTDELENIKTIYAPVRSVNILLLGESGVGKSDAAKQIHFACGGTKENFVVANCAELASGDGNLFRAELFGVKKGAYTGANEDRKGLFALAENGTIFLDEIAEIPLSSQVLLLRALQEKEYNRLGEGRSTPVKNVRIIAATNHNLYEDVLNGKFREDLYYRIAMCPVHLRALRDIIKESTDEFRQIVDAVLRKICLSEMNHQDLKFDISEDCFNLMCSYSWPGNIRQLHHVLLLACVYCMAKSMDTITEDVLKLHLSKIKVKEKHENDDTDDFIPSNLEEYLAEKKKYFVLKAFEKCSHNVARTARMLKMQYQKLDYYLKTIK